MKPCLTVFSGSKLNIDQQYKDDATELIEMLAQSGDYTFAYGGGYTGIMCCVRDACIKHQASIVGVNCYKWASDKDQELTKCVYYDSIIDRQNHLVELGDGYVVLPGGVGTLFEALQVITVNDVTDAKRPVFILNTNNYFEPFKQLMQNGRECNMINKDDTQLSIYFEDTPEKLFKCILQKLK